MPLRFLYIIGLGCLVLASTARADDSFRFLKVHDQIYTNVTVTTVTPTDIYFTHAHGLASAKLKDLDPDFQKYFHFDAARSARVEQADIQATVDFQTKVAQQKPATTPQPTNNPSQPSLFANGPDFVDDDLHARSIRGQSAPQLEVDKWLTAQPPDTTGKFVLVDLWATWSEPCQRSTGVLNGFQREFSDRLVIVGVSDESEYAVRRMTSPVIEYTVAIDREARMKHVLEVTAIPYCILIDPTGVVRFEGNPTTLDAGKLRHFLDKYAQ